MAKATPSTPEIAPKRQEHDAPLHRRMGKQRSDPHQAIDAHLDDHARHDGRDMAGRGRVGAGQPDVQRHDARLDAESHQGEDEDRGRQAGRQAIRGQGGEGERTARRTQQGKQSEQRQRGNVHGHQVNPARLADLLPVVFRDHQEERRTAP